MAWVYTKLVLVVSFSIRFIIYILHWPGKTIATGLFLISLGIFITLSLELRFFQKQTNKDRISGANSNLTVKNIIIVIGIFAIVLGSFFKVMHWSGASILLISGLVIIAAWAIIDLLLKKD